VGALYIATEGHPIYEYKDKYYPGKTNSGADYEIVYVLIGCNLGGFYPSPGKVFINGQYRYYNGFDAKETPGGLALIDYLGNRRDIIIPDEIGGVPVVAIGGGTRSPFAGDEYNDKFLQIASIVIPDSVKTIQPGVFRSNDLFSWVFGGGIYLRGGITIGADVTIMGENAGAGWDQGWGALDTVKIGNSNFTAYEFQHTGYWLDIGFIRFYNQNGRKAGKYTWTSTYNDYTYSYTFTWSFSRR
jgi:hypothetical protein